MKIGVISDTHCLPLPKKLLDFLSTVDLIVHAGDVCSMDTLRQLEKIKEVRAVCGNMCDSQLKKKLALKEYFECEGVHIGVTHGHIGGKDALGNAAEQFKGQLADIIIFGHSHLAFNQKVGDILFFNPGSPNDVVKAKFFSYGLIEIHDGKFQASIIKL